MSKQVSNDEITLREILIKTKKWYAYLVSQWKIILLSAIIGGALGLTYSLLSKPVYTATLSFALEDEPKGGGLSGALGLASQFGFDIEGNAGGIFAGANLIELFKSRTMVEQALLMPVTIDGKSGSFAEMYITIAEWRKKWNQKPALKNIQFLPNADREQFNRMQDSVLGVIYESLSRGSLKVAQKDIKLDIITIDTKSVNEDFAKYFTEALVKVVSDFYILTKSKKARINMHILQQQTDSIRGELNGAITGVAAANDNIFGLNPALNIRRVPSARKQVDVQANTAILTELVKQAELAKVTVRKETPLIQVIDKPIFPLKKERFGKAKGIVFGGAIAGFLAAFILMLTRALKVLLQ
ncbi:MAG: Wzz/FepE/Etk N-terminal domain-containing protein [Ferruginibacter sp.]